MTIKIAIARFPTDNNMVENRILKLPSIWMGVTCAAGK